MTKVQIHSDSFDFGLCRTPSRTKSEALKRLHIGAAVGVLCALDVLKLSLTRDKNISEIFVITSSCNPSIFILNFLNFLDPAQQMHNSRYDIYSTKSYGLQQHRYPLSHRLRAGDRMKTRYV